METRKIHPMGPAFSRIIAGAWRWHTVSPDVLSQLIHTSLDCGITTFDHADIYGDHENELLFGRILQGDPSLRSKMQLVSKCGIKLLSGKKPAHRVKHYDTSAAAIIAAAEQSLVNLHTDYLDLLLIHRPDPLMHPDEVAQAFTSLKQAGKVKHFGVSNFQPAQYDLLESSLDYPLVTNQVEISLFLPGPVFDGTLDHLFRKKASAMAWSPLGGGKFLAGENETGRRVLDGVQQLIEKRGGSAAQYLLAWLLAHPSGIFPVVGTTRPERIRESARAVDVVLDRQEWFEMLKWSTGKDVA